jgi:hypothetical protein
MSTWSAYRRMVRRTTGGRRDEIVDECGREPTAKQRGLSTLAFPRRLQLQRPPRSIDVWQYSLTACASAPRSSPRGARLSSPSSSSNDRFPADESACRRTQFESLSRLWPFVACCLVRRRLVKGLSVADIGRSADIRTADGSGSFSAFRSAAA